jgi:hypothetical protein
MNHSTSDLVLPTAGCWEIEGQVEGSVLRFVVEVYPRFYSPGPGRCSNLADVLENSNSILIGEVLGSASDRPGFVWQTVQAKQVWKGPVKVDEFLDILQDTGADRLLERGHTYLLFLQSQLGYPWRIFCPQRTLTEVSGEQVIRLNPQDTPLWSGNTLA